MSAIAIIPARGGSKRIPRKNVKHFLGKPIIAYSIEKALESGLFDVVMVSTDDEEIASISKDYGAIVPFFRSPKNSNDHATTADVICEVLQNYRDLGQLWQYACCIYPTAPLLKLKTIKDAFNNLKDNSFATVFPVVAYDYPIWRSLKFDRETGRVEMNWPENLNSRSQDLPGTVHDAGQFYWIDVVEFEKQPVLFGTRSGAVQLSELEVQDIDDEKNWRVAELKYSILNQ
jgi:pseudaminic acid cytidylyltransferase